MLFLILKTNRKPCGLLGFQASQIAFGITRAYNVSSCSGTCEQRFLTCLAKQPAVNSSVKKKCKYLCWKQNDETADPLLTILLYKTMRECLSSPARCTSNCWGAVLVNPSCTLWCPGVSRCTLISLLQGAP